MHVLLSRWAGELAIFLPSLYLLCNTLPFFPLSQPPEKKKLLGWIKGLRR